MQAATETAMPANRKVDELGNALQSFLLKAFENWESPEACAFDLSDAFNSAWCSFVGTLWKAACDHGQSYEAMQKPMGELYAVYVKLTDEWITTAKAVRYILKELRSPGHDNPGHVSSLSLFQLLQTIRMVLKHRGLETQGPDIPSGQTAAEPC